MTTLKQQIDAFRRVFGKKEMVALLLLVVAVIFYVGGLRPAEHRLGLMDQKLSEINRRLTQSNNALHKDGLDPAAKLNRFYQFFSREETVTDWLARLYDLADRTGVELRTGEYRFGGAEDAKLTPYHISLPVTGNYEQIRRFSEAVLNAMPVVALDQVTFRRKKVTDTQIEAEIRLTLYLAHS